MRFLRPRKEKPLFFDLRVYDRDVTILESKNVPVTKWHKVVQELDQKGAIPIKTTKENILEMMNKGL